MVKGGPADPTACLPLATAGSAASWPLQTFFSKLDCTEALRLGRRATIPLNPQPTRKSAQPRHTCMLCRSHAVLVMVCAARPACLHLLLLFHDLIPHQATAVRQGAIPAVVPMPTVTLICLASRLHAPNLQCCPSQMH